MDVTTNQFSWQLHSDCAMLLRPADSQCFNAFSDSSSDELATYSDPDCGSSSVGASYRQRTYTMPTTLHDQLETESARNNINRDEVTRKKFKSECDSDDVTGRRTGPAARTNQPREDDEKRLLRRERNKQAAARCRQRRVDLTNTLMAETESLQREKNELELEISKLQRQRNELVCVLGSHSSQCRVLSAAVNVLRTKTTVQQNIHEFPSIKTELIVDEELFDCFKTVPVTSSHASQQRPTHLPLASSNQFFDFSANGSTNVDQLFGDISDSAQRLCGNSYIAPTCELLSPTTLLAL